MLAETPALTIEQPELAPNHGRGWHAIAELMKRPQPVTLPMVVLFSIVPVYLFIPAWIPDPQWHKPEIALDHVFPLWAAWSMVYGSLFLAALLPVLVVHQQDLVRRTINAFLMAWLVAFVFFFAYPTIGPQPDEVKVDGFSTWLLQTIYASDHPYNCFPSLHVAQCFLAALACHRVHRGVGAVAGVWAFLVALSTLYTKQHYVLDVLGGALLAYVAYVACMRGFPREAVPEGERRLAPTLAFCAAFIYLLVIGVFAVLYAFDLG